MKNLIAVFILAALPVAAAESGAISDAERAFLIEQLEQSKKKMLASIDGLTAAQWRFKPAPNVWSVAECAEHIILSEDYIFNASQGILKTPAIDRMPSSNLEMDRKLVAGVEDRSQKRTAPEPITPSGGKFSRPEDAARAFAKSRDKTIAYVRTTSDDLRTHAADGPAGKMDCYQFLILVASHSARHTAQIREVESNPNFPKASAKAHHSVTFTLTTSTPE